MNISSNIDSVTSSIDKKKRDLRKINRSVRRVMDIVAEDARAYIRADADYQGQLRRSIGVDSDNQGRGEQQIRVFTDASIAPYAAIVEYGSGSNTNETKGMSVNAPPGKPPGGPYESPDIKYDKEKPMNLEGYPTFYGFVSHIQEWMEEKPVQPKKFDSVFPAAVFTAKQIIEKGQYAHPFLRPAWFQNELRVKRAARNALRRAVR